MDNMSIEDMVIKLLNEMCKEDFIFTDKAKDLIHKISERCKHSNLNKSISEKSNVYAKDLTAKEVYMDMLNKIIHAPTQIHAMATVKLLIPIIDKKLEEENARNIIQR